MRLSLPWDKRASVYDRTGTVMGVALILTAVGISLFLAGSIVGWFVGGAGMLGGAMHPRCPRCSKSPMQEALLPRHSPFAYFWQKSRLWPEHICSQCGFNLTTSQSAHADE